MEEPRLIEGGLAVDDRGSVAFVNEFDFHVKRFYVVKNWQPSFVRAWHGHKHEAKCVTVLSGAATVGVVKIKDWDKPDKNTEVHRYVLTAVKPTILYIPPGYANGLMGLTGNVIAVYFSGKTLEESIGDDWRYPWNYFGERVWEVEER